jgi:hypothetical protein
MQASQLDHSMTELVAHGGADYLSCLVQLSKLTRAERYLEIGTETGQSLSLIDCASVSVDPTYQLKFDVMGRKPACHLFQLPSDDFFARHDPSALLGGKLDLAFLVGLHHYEALLRDVINTERYCRPDSVILLHDCLPPTADMTNRGGRGSQHPKFPNFWTGDVYKTVQILMRYRPDLRIFLFDAPPTGLVAVTGLNPTSTVLADRLDEIVAEFAPRGDDPARLQAFMASITLTSTQHLVDRRSWKALLAGK